MTESSTRSQPGVPRRLWLLLPALLCAPQGCKKTPSPAPPVERRELHVTLPEPVPGTDGGSLRPIALAEEGFADVVLTITELRPVRNGRTELTTRGLYHDAEVGMRLELDAAWVDGGVPQPGNPSCEVILESMGEQSDRLVAALGELYRLPHPKAKMAPRVPLTGVSLEGDPGHPTAGPLTLRLLYPVSRIAERRTEAGALDHHAETPPDPDAFELYLSIDLPHRVVELAEKDESFRSPILRALAVPGR